MPISYNSKPWIEICVAFIGVLLKMLSSRRLVKNFLRNKGGHIFDKQKVIIVILNFVSNCLTTILISLIYGIIALLLLLCFFFSIFVDFSSRNGAELVDLSASTLKQENKNHRASSFYDKIADIAWSLKKILNAKFVCYKQLISLFHSSIPTMTL
jgi:hypothetical protein